LAISDIEDFKMKTSEMVLRSKSQYRIIFSFLALALTLGVSIVPVNAQQNNAIQILPGIENENVPQVSAVEGRGAAVENLPVVVSIDDVGDVPPSQDALSSSQSGTLSVDTNVLSSDPVLDNANNDVDDNIFYDAETLVPQGEFLENAGTVKLNPKTEPASRFVIVKRGSSRNSTKARLVSASRALKLARYDSALKIYDSLYKYNKNDPQILMGRALSLQHLGRIDEALVAYNDFLDRRPNDINARVNMLGLMVKKYPSVALRNLLDMYETNQSNVGVIAQIAFAYARMEQTKDALKYLGMAVAMNPNDSVHVYNMAIILDRAGRVGSAVEYYEKALEVDAINGSGSVPREIIYERLAKLRS